LDDALALIQGALEIDPWNGAYLDSLGWVYVKLGRLNEARDPLERAAREYPKDPTVLEHLGDYYDRTGDVVRAKTYWQRALDQFRETPDETGSKQSLEKKLEKVPVAAGPPASQAASVTQGP
jgi:tetratricopeptide (TPR) repeat protein